MSVNNGQRTKITVRRSYLVDPKNVETIKSKLNKKMTQKSNHKWMDTFYDTKSHQLSNAECILMKDTDSPKYWKFFCYAQDNIMEITTDEQEIKAPLSRLLGFTSPKHITSDLLKVLQYKYIIIIIHN